MLQKRVPTIEHDQDLYSFLERYRLFAIISLRRMLERNMQRIELCKLFVISDDSAHSVPIKLRPRHRLNIGAWLKLEDSNIGPGFAR